MKKALTFGSTVLMFAMLIFGVTVEHKHAIAFPASGMKSEN
jgi:hypothetical protein